MDYPKIHGPSDTYSGRGIAFEKLDGTNLGWEWDRELNGFWRAATRRREFYENDPTFGKAHAIFWDRYGPSLDNIFRMDPLFQHATQIKAFFEFYGPKSFAGQHVPGDALTLTLIDVLIDGVGLVGPNEFVDKFGHLGIPKILYSGRLKGTLLDLTKQGLLPVNEGVVYKGGPTGDVWMCKIKTSRWLSRLEAAYSSGVWTDADGRTHRIDHELREQRSG